MILSGMIMYYVVKKIYIFAMGARHVMKKFWKRDVTSVGDR